MSIQLGISFTIYEWILLSSRSSYILLTELACSLAYIAYVCIMSDYVCVNVYTYVFVGLYW